MVSSKRMISASLRALARCVFWKTDFSNASCWESRRRLLRHQASDEVTTISRTQYHEAPHVLLRTHRAGEERNCITLPPTFCAGVVLQGAGPKQRGGAVTPRGARTPHAANEVGVGYSGASVVLSRP
eukprot:scaffold2318_cov396-Prasinococcus_capsulatus_cf.AAC.1